MIKEWLMVVILAGNPSAPDLYIFERPTFDTAPKCIEWVNQNPQVWVPVVVEAYPNGKIDQVLCIKDSKLRELVPDYNKEREKEEKERQPTPTPVKGQFFVKL